MNKNGSINVSGDVYITVVGDVLQFPGKIGAVCCN
jgi:hypothetical protein